MSATSQTQFMQAPSQATISHQQSSSQFQKSQANLQKMTSQSQLQKQKSAAPLPRAESLTDAPAIPRGFQRRISYQDALKGRGIYAKRLREAQLKKKGTQSFATYGRERPSLNEFSVQKCVGEFEYNPVFSYVQKKSVEHSLGETYLNDQEKMSRNSYVIQKVDYPDYADRTLLDRTIVERLDSQRFREKDNRGIWHSQEQLKASRPFVAEDREHAPFNMTKRLDIDNLPPSELTKSQLGRASVCDQDFYNTERDAMKEFVYKDKKFDVQTDRYIDNKSSRLGSTTRYDNFNFQYENPTGPRHSLPSGYVEFGKMEGRERDVWRK